MNRSSIQIAVEVADALEAGQPVVALESTLIAHGLPWPENRETAVESEAVVRAAGATPATIAVLEGRIHVGLRPDEIDRLARTKEFTKASRRDLAASASQNKNSATTVSATLWVARTVGIGVLATGGLGGVHRGAQNTFDISADLDELGTADGVLVVCSGVKSILDMAATLEVLETRGVVVAGFRTDTFPAFLSPSGGISLDTRVDSASEAARLVIAHRSLGLPGAIVIAQPVPAEKGIPRVEMEGTIIAALEQAEGQGVSGKAITPFLLDFMHRATAGRSLKANSALIVANARLAAEIAVEIQRSSPQEGST
jgi:pseudouridine-5'-phosphate glycosidase